MRRHEKPNLNFKGVWLGYYSHAADGFLPVFFVVNKNNAGRAWIQGRNALEAKILHFNSNGRAGKFHLATKRRGPDQIFTGETSQGKPLPWPTIPESERLFEES